MFFTRAVNFLIKLNNEDNHYGNHIPKYILMTLLLHLQVYYEI